MGCGAPFMSIPKQHPFPFDPTYGATLSALQSIRPPEAPDGFDAFWEERYSRALTIDPKPAVSHSETGHADPELSRLPSQKCDGTTVLR